ncbi:hypothetical protein LIER_14182 [Lithospermum erythrorhizon]|uniref:Trafficking protein particle complex subunit 11 domain-containing protein n=1 Tax=Lithospermum erythrorhizon TaxID=34254 RepID=A0AAV3PZR5_LITER
MEDFPEEFRTPPVALAALIGCSDLHAPITAHLHASQPPINIIALPDSSKISVISKTPKDNINQNQQIKGILKRDWVLKHRTRVPAVVAAMFRVEQLGGDPAQWLQVCTDIESIRSVIQGRNIKLVVVVVTQSNSKDDLSEDRMIALKKRAEVDAKQIILFAPNEEPEFTQSLERLGSIFSELANSFYKDEGRRVKARLEKKNYDTIEQYIRYCFKVAVYAEFRRDWSEAHKQYEEAYHAVREMVGSSTRLPPIQRLVEIRTVAEQLYFKICTMLLHGGKIVEAIAWFRRHVTSYRKLTGVSEVIYLHWEWLSRQFLVFAELLETSSVTFQSVPSTASSAPDKPTEWEFQSAYYYQLAAQYLKEKSSCLEFALSMSEHNAEIDGSSESVAASAYIGQFARLLEHQDKLIMQPLSDEEYIRYTLAEGKRFHDSFEIIALFKRSFDAYNNFKASRMASHSGFQLGREYHVVADFSNAKLTFDSIASLYRQEGWVTLLWEVLGYLQDCSKRTSSVKDFVEYSLEMAALPVSSNGNQPLKDCGPAGPLSLARRENIQKEVFGVIRGQLEDASPDNDSNLRVNGDNPLYLEIDPVSPLRVALLSSVTFHEQTVKPRSPTTITISLISQLPLNVEIDQLEIQFNQSECNFVIVNGQRPQSASISNLPPGRRVETAVSLDLTTNKWLRLTYDIRPEQSGKLECLYVISRIGPHLTICCRAESPASLNDLPVWKFEDRLETVPVKNLSLAFSGLKSIQVEEPEPQVDLALGCSGSALVGENFVVPVIVSSQGHAVHSGEMKINLVDTRGVGLLSPKNVEPDSTENLHVELIGIIRQEGEDQPHVGSDNIQKIQPSFGLISLPSLKEGDSWSCKLEIRWNRPKPVMLFVSLGYFPDSGGNSTQKVHVHKSLQIEGKVPLVISHRFMLPFRREPLLLSTTKAVSDIDQIPSLPLKESCLLLASAKNSSDVPLRLLSVDVEVEDSGKCVVQDRNNEQAELPLLGPRDEFRKVFCVTPEVVISNLMMGTLCLKWSRGSEDGETSSSFTTQSQVVTKHRLSDVKVELPPLVVSLDSPPHAILKHPFTYSVKIQNQTQFLQEIKYSLTDSQSFVMSGFHNDTISVLPKSEHVLNFKLVPLASGSQQLPRVSLTSVRYSAGFDPSVDASTIFVFPSKPHFSGSDMEEMRVKSVAAS